MATKRVVKKQEKKAVAADIKETVQNVEKAVREKVEEKAPEMKEAAEKAAVEVKAAAEKATVEVKEAAEKASVEVKETVKKVRKAAIKKEVKTRILIQHQGKEIDTKDLIAAVKKEWTKGKNKVSDIKSIDLYVKPEDEAAYYVINGDVTGKVVL